MKIGIRREDKSKWEARTPLVPQHVKLLKEKYDIITLLQPSKYRVFLDEEYKKIGAVIKEDLSECQIVLGVKEMPPSFFQKNGSYMFFSHTIKGQEYNMPMLQKLLDLDCNLIDYETITDQHDRRLIFFGRFAGIAGMVNTLWAYGKKLESEGIKNPFQGVKKAYQYKNLEVMKKELMKIGKEFSRTHFPTEIRPIVCGIAGYGHVSNGAQEILKLFPTIEIEPDQLFELQKNGFHSTNHIYVVVFKEHDMVIPKDRNKQFVLQDYYDHPQKYESKFYHYLPHLSMLVNTIFWTPDYPRLVTKNRLHSIFEVNPRQKLKIIGDITCDMEGSIEMSDRVTEPDNPVYLYDPINQTTSKNFKQNGVLIMTRDNLPCEIPVDSSTDFSHVLVKFIPQILNAFKNSTIHKELLPEPLRKALIVYKGELTGNYKYLQESLSKNHFKSKKEL